MENKPKVLIAAPIAGEKQYSMGIWLDWISKQTYSNYEVCLCVNGKFRTELAEKLAQTEIFDIHNQLKIPIVLEMPNSDNTTIIQNLCYAREIILDYALNSGYDYIFFMDTDTIPHFRDAIQLLLDQNKDFISGLYFYKNSRVPIAISKDTSKNFSLKELKELVDNKRVVETWGVGYGCALLSKKCFSIPINYEEFKETKSDDFAHCDNLTAAGITLYFFPYVSCMHLGDGLEPFKIEKV
jgi:hypothetical protein